jgi:transcriptional regulator with XRE-family HTH domain
MDVPKVISKIKAIWASLADKEAREEYVGARLETDLAFQIYSLRKQRGWTQKKLAELCGNENGQGAICRLESSAEGVSLTTRREHASAFDVALSVRFLPFSEFVEESVVARLDRSVPPYNLDRLPAKFTICIQLASTSEDRQSSRQLSFEPTTKPWAMLSASTPSKILSPRLEATHVN